jgi:RNA polymerase sigma-70 factor (ECF subfamily)
VLPRARRSLCRNAPSALQDLAEAGTSRRVLGTLPAMSATGFASGTGVSESELVAALRAGDEAAFAGLVRRHHRSLVRLAMSFVRSEAIAEEVTQETWLAVMRGLDGFEGRSSLKTWIFHILCNQARSRGIKEQRSVPFSALEADEAQGPTVDRGRFRGDGDTFAGYWTTVPFAWWGLPEERVSQAETRQVVERTLAGLPARQRQVVSLRDVEGWSADEVCAALGVSEANQRVLLHRGRAQIRAVVEAHFAELADR